MVGIGRRQQGGYNYDMWALLWQVVEAKRIMLRARWVKSHDDEHPEHFHRYGLTWRDCISNCIVDKLAVAVEAAAETPHEASAPVLQMAEYTQLIQQRLAANLRRLVRDLPMS